MKTNRINTLLTDFINDSNGFIDSEQIIDHIFNEIPDDEILELFRESLRKSVSSGIKTYASANKQAIQDGQHDLFDFDGALAINGGVVKTDYATRDHLLAHKENSNKNRIRVDIKDDKLNKHTEIMLAGLFETESQTVGEWQERIKQTIII